MIITEKLTNRKTITAYSIFFMFTYLVSYLTRINFAAIVAEIEHADGIPETILGLAISGSSIFYGAGQLISGYFGDKFQPKKLIGYGLILTTITNCLIPLTPTPYLMIGIWCVNGLIQAFMWPPLVRLMGSIFNREDYSRACVVISWGSSFGTILIYLISPVIIMLSGWKYVFFFSATCGLLMSLIWWKVCPLIPSEPAVSKAETAVENKNSIFSIFSPLLCFVLLAIALQGALRDGVTNWTPTYIAKTFNVNAEFAILSAVILPIFSIFCFHISSKIYTKIKNPLTCAGLFFAVGFGASAILTMFHNTSMPLSVIVAALLCGCMHGVNLMLVCMVPAHYEKFGKISFVSGLINSFTYVGSAISTFGIAAIAEKTGNWQLIIAIWGGIALLGAIITFAFAKKYRNTMM